MKANIAGKCFGCGLEVDAEVEPEYRPFGEPSGWFYGHYVCKRCGLNMLIRYSFRREELVEP